MQYDPYEPLTAYSSKMKYKHKRFSPRSIINDHYNPKDGDFKCQHCHNYVVQAPYLTGVQNRNHCPYCLWSKHLDLNRSGDRLAACKGRMQPVGLALKKGRKKYAREDTGEMMLIHRCVECGKLSINRIAADDLTSKLYEVYRDPKTIEEHHRLKLGNSDIRPLSFEDLGVVETRLFGFRKGEYVGCDD